MTRLSLIFLAGGVGAVARVLCVHIVTKLLAQPVIWGTLGVNLVGCLLIGVVQGVLLERSAVRVELQIAIVAGLLGGFTTFSAFGWETVSLIREKQHAQAFAYVASSVVLGIALAFAGFVVGRKLG